jgi:hypothetical protein
MARETAGRHLEAFDWASKGALMGTSLAQGSERVGVAGWDQQETP